MHENRKDITAARVPEPIESESNINRITIQYPPLFDWWTRQLSNTTHIPHGYSGDKILMQNIYGRRSHAVDIIRYLLWIPFFSYIWDSFILIYLYSCFLSNICFPNVRKDRKVFQSLIPINSYLIFISEIQEMKRILLLFTIYLSLLFSFHITIQFSYPFIMQNNMKLKMAKNR